MKKWFDLPLLFAVVRVGKVTVTASATMTAKAAQLHGSWLADHIFACCDTEV